jgi:hypothetical protein
LEAALGHPQKAKNYQETLIEIEPINPKEKPLNHPWSILFKRRTRRRSTEELDK